MWRALPAGSTAPATSLSVQKSDPSNPRIWGITLRKKSDPSFNLPKMWLSANNVIPPQKRWPPKCDHTTWIHIYLQHLEIHFHCSAFLTQAIGWIPKNVSTLDNFEIAPGSAVGAHGWHDSPLRDVDKDQLRDIGTWTCTRDTSTGMAGIEERKKVTTCQTLTDPVTKEISYSKAYVDRLS